MAMGVPGKRRDPVAGADAAPGQRPGQLAGADTDLRIPGAVDGAFHGAADNIGALMIERGVINQPMHQHRPILHKTPHGRFPNSAGLR